MRRLTAKILQIIVFYLIIQQFPEIEGSNPAPATINCLVGTHEGPDFFVMCGRLWPSPLLGFCCLPKIGRQFLKDVLVEAVLYQESLPAPRATMLS